MNRFTLTLPSNSSMNYYPNNTASLYTTKLNEVIKLDGNWEVGLLEASFPSKATSASSRYTSQVANITKPDQIVVAMHLAQRRTFRLQPLYATFRTVQRKTRFAIKISISFVDKVPFSEDLACATSTHRK